MRKVKQEYIKDPRYASLNKMRAQKLLFCALLFEAFICHSWAVELNEFDFDLSGEDVWDDQLDTMIEKENELSIRATKYLSNAKIRNKFKKQWNQLKALQARVAPIEAYHTEIASLTTRIATVDSDITAVRTMEADVLTSFENKCDQIDNLLSSYSSPRDCCMNGLEVYCSSRTVANHFGFGGSAGDCSSVSCGALAG